MNPPSTSLSEHRLAHVGLCAASATMTLQHSPAIYQSLQDVQFQLLTDAWEFCMIFTFFFQSPQLFCKLTNHHRQNLNLLIYTCNNTHFFVSSCEDADISHLLTKGFTEDHARQFPYVLHQRRVVVRQCTERPDRKVCVMNYGSGLLSKHLPGKTGLIRKHC